MKWVTFFSQTGSEIVEISNHLQKWPDIICTNRSIDSIQYINENLLTNCFSRIMFLPDRPKLEEYLCCLKGVSATDIITLHGYLRIIPSKVCNSYKIYNGHPGDIINHPTLKGFNPQEKAFKLKIKNTGSVIHSVTAGVDEGPVVKSKKCKIDLKSISETYKILHTNSVNLWVEFLEKTFKIKK